MRYFMILASGLADVPVAELGGKTPLEAAHTPALDGLAQAGKTGCVRTLPEGLPASEEVALLATLGYDPEKYFSGEAGLAVADSGLRVGPDRLAFVHNMVTLDGGTLVDHGAGQITPKEAEALMTSLIASFGRPEMKFFPGRGFTGVTLFPSSAGEMPVCAPPEDALGESIQGFLPRGEGSELARRFMQASQEVFKEHEVNRVRMDLGENPATTLWLWGAGRPPALPSFESRNRLRATMVAATESARGLARLAGMRLPHLAGTTGNYRTDYAAKKNAALDLLYETDMVILHLASPAEASLEGNLRQKIAAIEDIDALVVAPLFDLARRCSDTRILFLSTHVASVMRRKRLRDETPFVLFGPGLQPLRQNTFSEASAKAGEIVPPQHGHQLLPYFLTR